MGITRAETHDPDAPQACRTANHRCAAQLSVRPHHNQDSLAPTAESISNNIRPT